MRIGKHTYIQMLTAAAVLLATACRDQIGVSAPPLPPAPPLFKTADLLVWRDSSAMGNSRAAADDHAVYTMYNHVVYTLDKSSGKLLWSTTLTYPPGTDIGGPGFWIGTAAGLVIVGDIDVFGLDPSSGSIVWRFSPRTVYSDEQTFGMLSTDGTTVYSGGVRGNLYAIDAATGIQRWVTHVTPPADTLVAVYDAVLANGAVYAGWSDYKTQRTTSPATVIGVVAVSAATGALEWSQPLPNQLGGQPNSFTAMVGVTSARVVAAGGDGYVYGLDIVTGVVTDTVSRSVFGFAPNTTDGAQFAIATLDTVVVVASSHGNTFLALDARDLRRQLWTSTASEGGVLDLAIRGGRVYTTYYGGQMAVTNIETGQAVWIFGRDDLVAAGENAFYVPAVDSTLIYLPTTRNVYAFQRK